MPLPSYYCIQPEIVQALTSGQPVVALESTVITHGLPYPENLELARQMECEVRQNGAIPATIAILTGQVRVGLTEDELADLATRQYVHKISSRDIAPAIELGWDGGTTVAGTLAIAQRIGLRVFATGGIGGVHRQAEWDISADLPQLATTPMVVVCAGAKAILDLPATLEYLETWAVPVVGYQTDEFPAFYSRNSGLKVSARADDPGMIGRMALKHWLQGARSALLVVNPPPQEVALPVEQVEKAIEHALADLAAEKISGQAVTPFLLQRVTRLTGGASLRANLGLLLNNARLAAQIAVTWPDD